MKLSILVLAVGLVLGAKALAQDASVGAGASNQSASSLSANRNNAGASASQANSAYAAAASKHATASTAESSEMNATLSKPIDARRAKPGDEVNATLAQDARGNAGTSLPRGTKLIGHVTEAEARERRSGSASGSGGGDSRLGIVFDKAVLSDGREVPVAATIQAVAEAQAATASGRHVEGWVGDSAFASGGAATAGNAAAGSGGLVGRVAGAGGATLGGAAGVGAGFGRTLTSSVGAANGSAAAIGGVGTSGQLLAGSRGVFGMQGVELVHGAAGSAEGSVLTSGVGNVQLGRGTQMLLVSQTAGDASAAGASGAAASNASATEQR